MLPAHRDESVHLVNELAGYRVVRGSRGKVAGAAGRGCLFSISNTPRTRNVQKIVIVTEIKAMIAGTGI